MADPDRASLAAADIPFAASQKDTSGTSIRTADEETAVPHWALIITTCVREPALNVKSVG